MEDFKGKDVNPDFIVPSLAARLAAGATAAGVRGYFLRQSGQIFYVLAFQGNVSAPSLLNKTFALNMQNGHWTELRIGATGQAPFPVYFVGNATSANAVTYVSGHYAGSPFFGKMTEVAAATDTITNGAGAANIYTEMRTPNIDFGTQNSKTMSRFGMTVADNSSTAATSGASVTLNVSWSDDDYATFSTPRELIYSNTLQFPFITQLGMFRQRAFKVTYAGTQFLCYKSITMDINKGQV
jgi:hypothetical protein